MRLAKPSILILSALAGLTPLSGQGRVPWRGTLDDRLASIEDRLSALESRLESLEEKASRQEPADRLTLESELKLDRLEVRVIQLENRSDDIETDRAGQRAVMDRIRSLERQVMRLRARPIR